MIFNSHAFVLFFAVFYPIYRALPHRARDLWLLAGSWFFYAYWDWRFLGLLLLSTAVDYSCGRLMEGREGPAREALVTASVVTNLGILATFKYLGFFTRELGVALEALGLGWSVPAIETVLPIGLSFYTFQSMAYTVDVYRGHTPPVKSFPRFATFISFFPQLVAGPIERSGRLIPQLEAPRRFDPARMASGTQLVLWGYFKKVYVADNLAVLVGGVFEGGEHLSFWSVLVTAWAFSWQIYCDFSGYTDIARGVARWLGIELSLNFRNPFFADGPQDLWRRWHISLSQWLRDYLYIPLGGSQGGLWRTQRNLMLTMVLGGLWHGANWTFVLWGVWHGGGLALQRAWRGARPGWWARSWWVKPIAVILTFHFTCFGFLIFRAHDLAQVYRLFYYLPFREPLAGPDLDRLVQLSVIVAPVLALELAQYLTDDQEVVLRLPRPVQAALSAAAFFAVVILGASYGREFIYFQF